MRLVVLKLTNGAAFDAKDKNHMILEVAVKLAGCAPWV
jgi:hypothetical protein